MRHHVYAFNVYGVLQGGGGGTASVIAFVSGTNNTVGYTLTYTPVSGNFLFVTAGNGNASTIIPTIGDSSTHSWQSMPSSPFPDTASGNTFAAWWTTAKVSSAITITIDFAAFSASSMSSLAEYSGVAASPIDGGTYTVGTITVGTDGIKSAQITTTADGDLVFSYIYLNGADTQTQWTAGTNYTKRAVSSTDPSDASHFSSALEDTTQASAGAIMPTWTAANSGTYRVFTFAIKHA